MHLDLPTIALLAGVAIVAFLLGRASARRRDTDLVSAQLAARPVTPPTDLREAVLGLLALNRRIEAIKLYRVRTNVGLAEAKVAVEAIEAGGFPAAGTPSPPPPASSGDLAAQAGSLKARGLTIQAIKVVREQTGMSLKDAKDFVDRL